MNNPEMKPRLLQLFPVFQKLPAAALDDGQAMSLCQMPECIDCAHGGLRKGLVLIRLSWESLRQT